MAEWPTRGQQAPNYWDDQLKDYIDEGDVVTKADVGLGNADNTSDVDKPVSTAQQTALDLKATVVAVALKAPLASPVFTGNPVAPTPDISDNDTSIATTAFVKAVTAALVDSSPTTLDTLNELAAALGDDPNFATTMATSLGLKAPLASPALTGNPTAPTPTAADNDTSIATTAFVKTAIADGAWIDVVFDGAWTNFDGIRTVQYMKDGLGFVHMRGIAKDGTNLMFNLPSGYRPESRGATTASSHHFPVVANLAFGNVGVEPDGDVLFQTGSNTWVDLSSIYFKAAAV